jgi:predicted helicase
LGNPPYAYASANTGAWITSLIQDYHTVDGEPLAERNSKGLQDDYVKFIRYGEQCIEETGSGILAFITNNGYLDNPTFRGMRQHLLDTFGDLYLLNLHGDGRKAETTPDGTADQNVFDIQTGVTIGLFVRQPNHTGRGRIHYADVWGRREDKYTYLLENDVSTICWHDVYPQKPFYLFVPHDDTVNLADEYQQWFKITDIFGVKSTGITTHHDRFVLAFDREILEQRVNRFRSSIVSDESLRDDFGLPDTKDWQLDKSRQKLRETDNWEAYFTQCLYRPFDTRVLYYQRAVVNRPRTKVMRHLLRGNNLALCTTRQVIDEFSHVLCTALPVDNSTLSAATRERTKVFPLYLYPNPDKVTESPFAPGAGGRQPNLNPAFVQAAARKLGMTFVPDGRGDCKHTFGPNDVFAYIYAILHSPAYRRRYGEFFKYDYPHIPLTHDKKLFRALSRKGRNLINLHLLRKSGLWTLMTGFIGTGSNLIEDTYPRYTELSGEEGGRVYINATKYFAGMPSAVWDFRIGGQRVLEKWLKNRRGRTLTFADTLHYQKIVVALAETLRMMDDIDDLIPVWPLL